MDDEKKTPATETSLQVARRRMKETTAKLMKKQGREPKSEKEYKDYGFKIVYGDEEILHGKREEEDCEYSAPFLAKVPFKMVSLKEEGCSIGGACG